jgi:hypothetical protein
MSTGDIALVDILVEEENKGYLKLIEEQKYDIEAFIKKYIINREVDYQRKKKYGLFFEQVQVYLQNCYKNGKFNYLSILDETFKSLKVNSENL